MQSNGESGETKLSQKAFVKDTLVSYYLEQQNMARHHEEQRATVSTIFCTLAAADIGLMGVLMQEEKWQLDNTFLPLTFILIALGILGFLITMKLFERADSHFKLSEAYLHTINSLIDGDLNELITRDKTQNLKYVDNARGETGFTRITEGTEPSNEFTIKPLKHNPVDPRPIVEPFHNQSAVYWQMDFAKPAILDLFRLWSYIYTLITLTGISLSYWIIYKNDWHSSIKRMLLGLLILAIIIPVLRLIIKHSKQNNKIPKEITNLALLDFDIEGLKADSSGNKAENEAVLVVLQEKRKKLFDDQNNLKMSKQKLSTEEIEAYRLEEIARFEEESKKQSK